MASGYEKSPDYGDPPPRWGGDWTLAAVLLAAAAGFVWLLLR